jgi:hypothetical protein
MRRRREEVGEGDEGEMERRMILSRGTVRE